MPPTAPDALPAPRADDTRYDEPFSWWGYHWTPPEPRSIVWLLRAGALDAQLAAFLTLAVELRRSLVVVAEPHEAGKTTLLTALLDFLPPETQRVYLRGWYERFTFADLYPPERAYLLCNEISAHLPTYLWGRGVRRVFEAQAAGYPLATTMHASGADDALAQLRAYPLETPSALLGRLDLVVGLGVGYVNNRVTRRVVSVERITPADGDSPRIESLATRAPLRAELALRPGRLIAALAHWLDASDAVAADALARRERRLNGWVAAGIEEPEALRAALAAERA